MKNIKAYVNNNVTVFVEGIGFVGVGTFKTPDIILKKVKATGAAGEYQRTYGALEELKASCNLEITNPIIYTSLAKMDDAILIFATAINKENMDAEGERNVLRGNFDIKIDERKNGEIYKVTLELYPQYYLQEIGGKPVIEVDMLKNIARVNGIDLLEKTRKALEIL